MGNDKKLERAALLPYYRKVVQKAKELEKGTWLKKAREGILPLMVIIAVIWIAVGWSSAERHLDKLGLLLAGILILWFCSRFAMLIQSPAEIDAEQDEKIERHKQLANEWEKKATDRNPDILGRVLWVDTYISSCNTCASIEVELLNQGERSSVLDWKVSLIASGIECQIKAAPAPSLEKNTEMVERGQRACGNLTAEIPMPIQDFCSQRAILLVECQDFLRRTSSFGFEIPIGQESRRRNADKSWHKAWGIDE